MTREFDLIQNLETLRQLLHEYSDLAIECLNKNNLVEHGHHIHELKAKLDHLKYLSQENQNKETANNKNFFAHHTAALQHAVNHHFIIEQQLAAVTEMDAEYEAQMQELQEIYRELQRLYELLKQQQTNHPAETKPFPTLSPFGHLSEKE